jgi:hypothetical protein
VRKLQTTDVGSRLSEHFVRMMCQGWEIPHVYGHSDIEPPLARKPTILGCLKALGFSCGRVGSRRGSGFE